MIFGYARLVPSLTLLLSISTPCLVFRLPPLLILHMSLCSSYSALSLDETPRKRTTSFSYPNQSSPFSPNPRPSKVPRITKQMGSLRRTETYICLSTNSDSTTTKATQPKKSFTPKGIPHNRTLQYYKDQRQRQKAQLNRSVEPITIRIITEPRSQPPTVRHTPSQPPKPSRGSQPTVGKPIIKLPLLSTTPFPRQSSPLAPKRSSLPDRPVFPRSKPEPDLYRKALTSCLKRSPEGQQFLRMSKKLTSSVMNATMELERIVAAQTQREETQDVVMADAPPGPTKPWVVLPAEDWEMVDGTA